MGLRLFGLSAIPNPQSEMPHQAMNQLRTLIHPLCVRSTNLAQSIAPDFDQQKRGSARIIGLKAMMDYHTVCKEMANELMEKGGVKLAARGGQSKRAIDLISNFLENKENVQVCRYDGQHTFEDGTIVNEIIYLLNDPLRQLQIRLESGRKA